MNEAVVAVALPGAALYFLTQRMSETVRCVHCLPGAFNHGVLSNQARSARYGGLAMNWPRPIIRKPRQNGVVRACNY